jgi:tetratricopeptide (TPR) repeat protein
MSIDGLTTTATSTPRRTLSAVDRRRNGLGRPRYGAAVRAASLAASLALSLALLGPGVPLLGQPAASAATENAAPPTTTTAVAAAKEHSSVTDTRLTMLETSVRATPTDGPAWKDLASAYVRRAYETADPSYYPLAANALKQAGMLLKNAPAVRILRANFFLALHNFAGARDEAAAVLALQPNSFEAHLALADATIELGGYDAASEIVDRLVDQRPGVASLSRLSYIRQLHGDLLGAETAMRAAVSSAPEGSLDRAVTLAYLGEVLLERGRGDAAARAFTDALAIHPASSVAAIGLARIESAKGDFRAASVTLANLVDRVPLPAALGLQAELARARHDKPAELAANQLVDASIDLFKVNGAIVDAESAILLADRGPASAADALAAADRAYAARQTIFTDDARAWALFQSHRAHDAVPFINAALATNPAVASVHWHAAAIFDAVGDRTMARRQLTLAVRNPWFSPAQRPAVVALSTRLGVMP